MLGIGSVFLCVCVSVCASRGGKRLESGVWKREGVLRAPGLVEGTSPKSVELHQPLVFLSSSGGPSSPELSPTSGCTRHF